MASLKPRRSARRKNGSKPIVTQPHNYSGGPMPTSDKKMNAIQMLKEDHNKVKELFDKFEETNGSAAKERIVNRALMELKVHAGIEEEIFYPAVRQQIEDEEGIMDEADEEHHVAKV